MTTQVLFRMDKNLKEKAARKARAAGLTLSAVFNMAARAYVDRKAVAYLFPCEPGTDEWQTTSGRDIIKNLGKIPKKERDYYENL